MLEFCHTQPFSELIPVLNAIALIVYLVLKHTPFAVFALLAFDRLVAVVRFLFGFAGLPVGLLITDGLDLNYFGRVYP